jgi:hypothetical protein
MEQRHNGTTAEEHNNLTAKKSAKDRKAFSIIIPALRNSASSLRNSALKYDSDTASPKCAEN